MLRASLGLRESVRVGADDPEPQRAGHAADLARHVDAADPGGRGAVLLDPVLSVALRAAEVADAHLDDRRRRDVDRALLGPADRQPGELLAIADQAAQGAGPLALLGALPPDHAAD